MRIGEINKDNYIDFMKLFRSKNSKTLDELWGKDKKANNTTRYIFTDVKEQTRRL